MPISRRYALCLLGAMLAAGCLIGFAADPRGGASPAAKRTAQQAPAKPAAAKPTAAALPAKQSTAKFTTEKLRGKVVWLEDALARRYGVATEPDAQHTSVVLEMADGRLWPIVPDTRGRAFVVDERLRDLEIEVLARRYDLVPMIQVIRVFRDKPAGTVEIDYWCDICAIPMYILKPCECCQGETRLRERPLSEVPQ